MITQTQARDLKGKIQAVINDWSDKVIKQKKLTDPKVLRKFISSYCSPGEEFTTNQLTIIMESEYGKVNGQKLSVTMTQLEDQGFLKVVRSLGNKKVYTYSKK